MNEKLETVLVELKKCIEESKKLRLMIDNIKDYAIFLLDVEGRVTEWNKGAERFFQYKSENIIGKHFSIFFTFEDNEQGMPKQELEVALGKHHAEDDNYLVREDGSRLWASGFVTVLRDESGNPKGFVKIVRDMTQQKIAQDRINQLVFFDALTNLPNRTLFNDRLKQAIAFTKRDRTKIAIIFLDLDRFKNVNDSLGHNVGDMILQSVAKRLLKCVREIDTVSRQGGDEFMIILNNIKSKRDVESIAKNIIKNLTEPFDLVGENIKIGTSIGIVIFPAKVEREDKLTMYADAAMYDAKNNGGNNYQFYREEIHRKQIERLRIEDQLRKGIINNELVLYYQPKVDIGTKEIVQVEALVRWINSEGELMSPLEFIPIAEDSDLINSIGSWVLRNACSNNKRLQDKGLKPIIIAVNISARQFNTDILVEILSVLKETGLEAKYLELEITERVIMNLNEEILQTLLRLKAIGIRISIDDFGTGYSSLSYLKRLPVDTLKIDRLFINDVPKDKNDLAIVSAIISMAHKLDLSVIAEGVERKEQVEFLENEGCDQIQGYYISKPLPFDTLSKFISSKQKKVRTK